MLADIDKRKCGCYVTDKADRSNDTMNIQEFIKSSRRADSYHGICTGDSDRYIAFVITFFYKIRRDSNAS